MKLCTTCNTLKPIDQFNKKGTSLQAKCKTCNSEYLKAHYINNKKSYFKRNDKHKAGIIQWFKELKLTLKCLLCSEDESACLDFHHLDPTSKEFDVSKMPGYGISKKSILKEISKCIVLCANCHRKLHAGIITLKPSSPRPDT